jgi:hypothetical protein
MAKLRNFLFFSGSYTCDENQQSPCRRDLIALFISYFVRERKNADKLRSRLDAVRMDTRLARKIIEFLTGAAVERAYVIVLIGV